MVNLVGTVNVSEVARAASRRIGFAYANSATTLATAPLEAELNQSRSDFHPAFIPRTPPIGDGRQRTRTPSDLGLRAIRTRQKAPGQR